MTDFKFLDDADFDAPRSHYKLIRWRLLDCYYTYCRGKLRPFYSPDSKVTKGWAPNEHELGYAYEQCEYGSLAQPIEKLMLEVLNLILDGGRSFYSEQFMSNSMNKIKAILEANDLQRMLAELPDEERKEFEYDLRLLKILTD